MDLESMLKREDFFSFFFSSVERYYQEALDESITFSFATSKRKCNMVIKPKLSAASSVRISNKAREFYYSEWNIRGSIVKNWLAKIYVFFATRTGYAFSQYRFTITPEPANCKDIVIAPNNRSIRIFDYSRDIVGCIIKSGFTDKFFKSQLEFRKKYKYDFILPLLKTGNDWFQEPIMYGHPLARITDEVLYRKAMQDAVSDMAVLAHDTILYADCDKYILGIEQKLMQMLDKAKKKKEIRYAEETRKIICFATGLAKQYRDCIPTVISHGDLQGGNIWVDLNHKTWIYDWETAERRSIWYDSSVLQYSLRRNDGWKQLMGEKFPSRMRGCEESQIEFSVEEYDAIKGVVLLEDISFYLEDMLELPEDWGADLYDAFIKRILDIDQVKMCV